MTGREAGSGGSGACEWTARALLLDLDGVLVDSTASVEQVWRAFAARHGIDEAVLSSPATR